MASYEVSYDHASVSAIVTAAHHLGCDHCPAERCALLTPCAAGPHAALDGARPTFPLAPLERRLDRAGALLVRSTVEAPPTPPPVTLA